MIHLDIVKKHVQKEDLMGAVAAYQGMDHLLKINGQPELPFDAAGGILFCSDSFLLFLAGYLSAKGVRGVDMKFLKPTNEWTES